MFEFLTKYKVSHFDINMDYGPNVFFPLSENDISKQERRLGFDFPFQLRTFYKEIGNGFITANVSDAEKNISCSSINRFITPEEATDLYIGEDVVVMPEEGFGDDELPFFEIGDGLFLVMRKNCNGIYWSLGDLVANDLVEFVKQLLDSPIFYM